jgi:hypothetical protein
LERFVHCYLLVIKDTVYIRISLKLSQIKKKKKKKKIRMKEDRKKNFKIKMNKKMIIFMENKLLVNFLTKFLRKKKIKMNNFKIKIIIIINKMMMKVEILIYNLKEDVFKVIVIHKVNIL